MRDRLPRDLLLAASATLLLGAAPAPSPPALTPLADTPPPRGVVCAARSKTISIFPDATGSASRRVDAAALVFPALAFETENFRLHIAQGEARLWVAAEEVVWQRLRSPRDAGSSAGGSRRPLGTRGWQDDAAREACRKP